MNYTLMFTFLGLSDKIFVLNAHKIIDWGDVLQPDTSNNQMLTPEEKNGVTVRQSLSS